MKVTNTDDVEPVKDAYEVCIAVEGNVMVRTMRFFRILALAILITLLTVTALLSSLASANAGEATATATLPAADNVTRTNFACTAYLAAFVHPGATDLTKITTISGPGQKIAVSYSLEKRRLWLVTGSAVELGTFNGDDDGFQLLGSELDGFIAVSIEQGALGLIVNTFHFDIGSGRAVWTKTMTRTMLTSPVQTYYMACR